MEVLKTTSPIAVPGARAAYQRAVDSGHPEAFPQAAVNYGCLLMDEGDIEGARAMFRRAAESGHAEAAPIAADYLDQLT